MKKSIPLLLIIFLSLILSGCFILELILPPIGGGTSRIALYVNYNGVQYTAHRLSGVECLIKKVELLSNGQAVKELSAEKSLNINLRPTVQIESFSSLLNLLQDTNIAQFEFERDADSDVSLKNPQIRLTFSQSATAVYTLENEVEETTFATSIALTIPAQDLIVSVPIKDIINNQYVNKGTLSLPIGQTTLYVMLNLANIPPIKEITGNPVPVQLTRGFVNSISMIQDDSMLVYGTIENNSDETDPALIRGENWVLNFYDYYFNEKDFVMSSYSMSAESAEQYYYFMVPSNNYNSTIYLRPPGLEDEDDYSVDVTIGDQEQIKQAPRIIYPPE